MLDIKLEKVLGDVRLNISFVAEGVGVTALSGHSGAGKTSVVNMIAGLMRPDAGRIVVNGRCVFDSRTGIDLPPEKRRFGYVFQDGRLFPHLSVRSNLVYGMKRTPVRNRHITFDTVVELLGIGHLLKRHPANLSGGEKQRVAIGRALLTSPSLLLMDEPLASLDAARKKELLPFIARLPRETGTPILYVSHSSREIRVLADHTVVMKRGEPAAAGNVGDCGRRTGLSRFQTAPTSAAG